MGAEAQGGGQATTAELLASLERGLAWLLPLWAVGLLLFLVLATEPLGLDEGAESAAPLVFLLAVATASLLLGALAFAVRHVARAPDFAQAFAWSCVVVALVMASLMALNHLTVATGDYEGERCHRLAILPSGTFNWLAWIPWPAWAGTGVALGATSLVLLAVRRTRGAGAWLLGTFALLLLLSAGALDGCPDL